MARKVNQPAKKKPVAGSQLKTELAFYGCEMDPGVFEELLADMLANLYPDTSPEQLLYDPDRGLQFCKAIRARSRDSLPSEMILRRLRNMQKRPTE